ncbi:MAG: Ger(x)C family spore germination protein [Clostridia bacterium]
MTGRNRICAALMIIWITAVFLTGCWDKRELEELFVAYTAGIDIDEKDSGILSFSLSGPTVEEKAEEANISVVSQGKSIQDAMINIQSKLYREVVLGHIQVLLIGEETAKEGISVFLDAFFRNPYVRGTLLLGITKGKASELLTESRLKQHPYTGIILKKLLQGSNREGISCRCKLVEFFRCLGIEGKDPCMPYLIISPARDQIIVNNIAVFRGDRLAGTLDRDESIAAMILMDKMNSGKMVIDLSKSGEESFLDSSAVNIYRTARKITALTEEDKVKIKVELKVTAELSEDPLYRKTISKALIDRQERLFEEKLKSDAIKTLKKLQAYKSDIVCFGEIIRARHPDFFQGKEWREIYANADFDIDVHFRIRRVGTVS